ncbi:large conductance mechanosensitive channel protein MscL [Kitasatospora sp. DSM 101779]|uniref:large conductance mechanosensitive channel protein MscL n=1 Tax=Kitasatospora sp. DSM 101779 TaxID=2853165 RepID=UPI0021D85257|nr:large conductance mechanosensitive channel protein MscL [Kitasatospora sp. DSM 101779]MCU7823215.1 large conductance mechanosensitive channel protein MscL [Kitasatospora sp. DSM 101779]
MKGFKEFLLRGNVVDLAVAVVIGAAFTNIINAFAKGVINPIIGLFGTKDLASYRSCLKGPCTLAPDGSVSSGILILWGEVLSAVVQFLITAAVVYFVFILPMLHFMAKRKTAEEEVLEAEEKEVLLLTEIRDALVRRG